MPNYGEIWYGENHAATKELNTTQIAKLFREQVKEAVKTGALPKGLKLSIRSEYFSGGSAIRAKITACPVQLLNPAHDPKGPWGSPYNKIYTDEAEALKKRLEDMLQSYNYDGSDSSVDYFRVRFYGHVDFCHDLERAERVTVEALKPSAQTPAMLESFEEVRLLARQQAAEAAAQIEAYYAGSLSAGPVFTGPNKEAERQAALAKAELAPVPRETIECEVTRFTYLEID